MGKNRNGLRKERGLKIVRGAGFKKHKRKQLEDVAENSRAGLDIKSDNSAEIERVKRKKPLALKHKRRIKKAIVALSAVMIAALSLFGYGFFVGNKDDVVLDGVYQTAYIEPESGVTPKTAMSSVRGYSASQGEGSPDDEGWKTIGYLNYVLRNQPYYYSSMESDIAITVIGQSMLQHVETEKQFYNDVLISSEITTTPQSILGIKIESANQFCVISNPEVVMWRKSASSDSSTFDGKDTVWADGQPEGATYEDYRKTRGNIQSEFSVYVINHDTLLGWSEIRENGDGTYSQDFVLNYEAEPADESAIYYYQLQMKASGGLPSFPVFNSVNVTYTFDENWQILRSDISESYIASYGGFNADGNSTSVTEYTYSEQLAANNFYDNFFKQYETSFGTPTEKGIEATDCLSSAFGDVLTGEAKLAADLEIGGKPLSGIIHLNISQNDVRVDLGNVKVYMRPEGGGNKFYVAYGDGVKVKFDMSALSSSNAADTAQPLAAPIDGGAKRSVGAIKPSSAKTAALELDTNELMSQLMGGDFTVSEDGSYARLSSTLDIFGIKINIAFNFNIENGSASLDYLEASLELLGSQISARARFTDEGVSPLSESAAAEYPEIDIAAIKSLIGSEALDLNLSYADRGIDVSGHVTVNLKDIAVKADLTLVAGGDTSSAKYLSVIYKDGEIYLSLNSEGLEPVRIKGDTEKIMQTVQRLFKAADGESGEGDASEEDVASRILGAVIGVVKEIGLDNILNTVLADREFADCIATSGENGFTLTVDGSALVEKLGGEFDLGNITVNISADGISVSALGISGSLASGEPFAFDENEYAEAEDLIPILEKVEKIIEDGGLSVDGGLGLTFGGTEIGLTVNNLSIGWADGIKLSLDAQISIGSRTEKLTVFYDGSFAAAALGDTGVYLDEADFEEFKEAVGTAAESFVGDGAPDMYAALALIIENLKEADLPSLLNSLALGGADGKLNISVGGLTLSVADEAEEENGILGISAEYAGEKLTLEIEGHVAVYSEPTAPDCTGYFDGSALIPLVNEVSAYAQGGGLSVTGSVALPENGLNITLKNVAVSWKDGFALRAEAELVCGELDKNIFINIDDEISVYYDGLGVKLEKDGGEEFINAVQSLYGKIASVVNAGGGNIPKELTLNTLLALVQESGNTDISAMLGTLDIRRNSSGNLEISLNDGQIAVEFVNDDGTFKLNANYKDKAVITLSVGRYKECALPDAACFDAADLIPLMKGAEEILSDGGLTLGGELTLDTSVGDIGVKINDLSVSWKNENSALNLSLDAILTLDGTSHSVYALYDGANLSVVYDNVGLKLANEDVGDFTEAAVELYNAIASKTGLTELEELSADGIKKALGLDEKITVEKIAEILKGLRLTSVSGNLGIGYGAFNAEIVNTAPDGLISANIAYGGSVSVSGEVHIGRYTGGSKLPKESELTYFDAADILPVVNKAAQIIKNDGVTLSGEIALAVGSTQIDVTVYALSLNWKNGIELALDVRLSVGGSEHDIYAEYSANSGNLTFVYGPEDGGVGAQINLNDDVPTFKAALVALYNRLADVINTMVENKPMKHAETLEEAYDGLTPVINTVLDLIKAAQDASDSLRDITDKIDDVKKSEIDVLSIINSICYNAEDGKFSVEFSGMNISVWGGESGLNLALQTGSAAVELSNFKILSVTSTDLGISAEELLSADDVSELLDFVAAGIEMLAKDNFSISLDGKVTTTDERYADKEFVKYNIDAGFDYSQGSEFPIHIDTGKESGVPNFWISPDMYAHVYVNLISTILEEDSVLFDIYIFDGNPAIDDKGLTAGTLSSDGELDIYMTLSRIPEGQEIYENDDKHNAVKVYAPVSEIMTIASAGVAMADLGSITTEYQAINEIIGKVADTLDVLLVDKYLTYTKDQFSSLGSSLLEQILGESVSSLVNRLLSGVAQKLNGQNDSALPQVHGDEPTEVDGLNRLRKGAIGKFGITYNTDESGDVLSSVFEISLNGGATASVTKEKYEFTYDYTDKEGAQQSELRHGTRITGVNVSDSALNETDTLASLAIKVGYDGVKKPESLDGYMSFVGVDRMLQALVNSATNGEYKDGEITYDLNRNFFISGELGLKADFVIIELDHVINVKGLSVSIDKNNDVSVNARLSYSGVRKALTIVNGDTDVELSIKNGMIYIKRVQTTSFNWIGSKENITPITIYRAMPLDTFMSDIMNQLFFVLNLNSELINNIINLVGSNGEKNQSVGYKQDYGEMLSDYLQSIISTETDDAASWKISLNGAGINRLAGMSGLLGDGTSITFSATRDRAIENDPLVRYVVNSLSLQGKFLSVFDLSGNFKWHNPKAVISDEDAAVRGSIDGEAPCVAMEKWFGVSGKYSFEDIRKNIQWDKLATTIAAAEKKEAVNPEFTTETQSYLEIVFEGDVGNFGNITSHARLANFEYYLNDGVSETLLSRNTVLADSNGEICGLNEAPDISSYEKEHYELVWGETTHSGTTYRRVASYAPERYKVSIHSPYSVEGFEYSDVDYLYEYEHVYGEPVKFDMSYEIRTENSWDTWYRVDYLECNGEKYYSTDIAELNIQSDSVINVVWKEIPHSTVTVISDQYIEGFQFVGGKRQKQFEIETGTEVNLLELVGNIADTEEGYTFGGFTFDLDSNETSDIICVDGDETVYVKWIEPEITVNYYSSLQAADFSAASAVAGYDSAYTLSKTYTLDIGFGVFEPAYSGYEFLGWFYNDGKNWIKVTDVKNDIEGSDKYSNAVDLHALWYSASANCTKAQRTERKEGSIFKKTYHTFYLDVNLDIKFEAVENLLDLITVSDVNYRMYFTFDDPAPKYYATDKEYQDTKIGSHTGVLPCNHYSKNLTADNGLGFSFVSEELQSNSGADDYTTWNVVYSYNLKFGDSVLLTSGESENNYLHGRFAF